ncbi:MAG: carboxypeptidase-like regulatory domain-containing protein, partial [bacterium]
AGAGGFAAGGFGGGPDGPGGAGGSGGCATGAVNGLACAPDGTPIGGARVHADTTDCAGNRVTREAFATADGHFRLDGLAPGPATVFVTAGRFQGRYDVVVLADRSVPVDERSDKECLPSNSAQVAAVTGEYDSIERIVGGLGFEFTAYCGDTFGNYGARGLLGHWESLSRYDVLLINCGFTVDLEASAEGQQMVSNLRRFVAEGGAVYISDLAANVIEAAWPDKIQFDSEYFGTGAGIDPCCTCVDCPARCGAQAEAPRPGAQCRGGLNAGELICGHEPPVEGFGDPGRRRAQIIDPALRQFLGRDALDVNFDQGGWMGILGVGAGVDVLVADGREPLMVMFTDGASGGRVAYTTFHNEAQATADVQQILTALLFQL